eukprot:jgi/Undpi1/2446/HiC_scaffold_13.g05827.m1
MSQQTSTFDLPSPLPVVGTSCLRGAILLDVPPRLKAPVQSACENNEDSRSSDSEGSAAAGDGALCGERLKAPVQSACENNEDSSSSSSYSEGSVAAGDGITSTKSPSSSSYAAAVVARAYRAFAVDAVLLVALAGAVCGCLRTFGEMSGGKIAPHVQFVFSERRRQNLRHGDRPCSYVGSLCGGEMV